MNLKNEGVTRHSDDPSGWTKQQIDRWFEKGDWLDGLKIAPDASINRKAFAVSYYRDPEKWRKSFEFLRKSLLGSIEFRRYDINEKVYAVASSYITKNHGDCRYEVHRKYIDIQYLSSGRELIGHADIKSRKETLSSYDTVKDIEFMTVDGGIDLKASQDTFFIFFPEDAHCPGMKDGENTRVEKIVVKLMADDR